MRTLPQWRCRMEYFDSSTGQFFFAYHELNYFPGFFGQTPSVSGRSERGSSIIRKETKTLKNAFRNVKGRSHGAASIDAADYFGQLTLRSSLYSEATTLNGGWVLSFCCGVDMRLAFLFISATDGYHLPILILMMMMMMRII